MLCGYAVGIIGNHFLPNVFQIWSVFRYMIFFYLGVVIRKYGMEKLKRIPFLTYILIDIVIFCCYILVYDKKGWLFRGLFHGILLVLKCVGSVGSFVIFQKLGSKDWIPIKIREFGKQYSMSIYLFHQQLIYITLEIGNGRMNNYCLAIINFIFALAGASIISVILYKFSLTKYLITGKDN